MTYTVSSGTLNSTVPYHTFDPDFTFFDVEYLRNDTRYSYIYVSASAVVIHYEEAIYQVYGPLPFTFYTIPYCYLGGGLSRL